MRLFELDILSILYSLDNSRRLIWRNIRGQKHHIPFVVPLCKKASSLAYDCFSRLAKFVLGAWRQVCAYIAQSNKHTFVDLINDLKEWDWKKNYRRRHDDFDLRRDGPCS